MMNVDGTLEALVSASYGLLVLAWGAVLVLLWANARAFFKSNRILSLICIVLAIDAGRSIVESLYFGSFFSAYFGRWSVFPLESGGEPASLLAVKLVTLVSAAMMFFFLRRLLPAARAAEASAADRIKAEAEREFSRQIEEKNQSLIMAQAVAKIGSWSLDIATNELVWSDENYRIHAMDPDRYKPSLSASVPYLLAADAEVMRQGIESSVRTGRNGAFEHRVVLSDGTLRYVEERWHVLADANGQPERILGTCQDVTDRKIARENLDRSDALLRMAGKIARIGGWSVNASDRKLTWSDEVFKILEYPPSDEPPLAAALDLYPPEWRELVASALEACLKDGVPFDMELEINTALGNRLDVRCVAQADRDTQGNVICVHGAFQDISAIKVAERALNDSADRLALLSMASKDAIWDWDLAADVFWWNAGFDLLFGYGPEEVPLTRAAREELIHPDDRSRVRAGMDCVLAGDAVTWSDSYRYRRRDRSYANVDDRGFLIRDESGRVVRMVGGMTDVTARVQLELQYSQVQRLDSLGQLTGGVAHDFNNLLTVIIGGAEMLEERLSEDPDACASAAMVLAAAARGAELTNHLLAFSRQQPLVPKVVDVPQLVAQVEPMLIRTLGEHVQVRFDASGSTWPVHVDAGQLQNALLNLCLNARDAMPGGGLLTIEATNTVLDEAYAKNQGDFQAGHYVMLAVSDTGDGISQEHLPHVFEPFFTTKEVGRGTGLGLAMVYGFVKQSGGHIRIYSEPDEGTTIRIYLPRYADEPSSQDEDASAPTSVGGNETILLVEDDALVRCYASEQLSGLGYRVVEAQGGEDALRRIAEGLEVDMLFTDVVMPGMNGRELADEAMKRCPGLRVLFTSGYAESAIVHQGRLDAGVSLLSKPYSRLALARKVREVLDD